MKKSLIVTLALVFVLGIVGTAFAATNPFVDVPAKHWAYGSITQLANAGIIDGYGDGTFRGDQLMTRYEMAQIVAKAMAKSDKANAEQKAAIDKLAVEFAAELNNLGVRVSKLEANASTIKFTGDARVRFQQNWALNNTDQQRWQERVRINMAANLADNVMFNGTIAAQNSSDVAGNSTSDQIEYSIAKFTFKNVFPASDISVGRDALVQGSTGMVAGTIGYYDSVRMTFGNPKVLSGWVAYGDIAGAPGLQDIAPVTKTTVDMVAAQLKWNTSKVTTLYAFMQQGKSIAYTNDIYGGGLQTKAGNFTILGDWLTNNDATSDADAWYAQLWYKGADKAKVGSYGLSVEYRDIGASSIDTNLTGLDVANKGVKGWSYRANYTVAKNVIMTADVENLDPKAGGSNDNIYYFRTEFWF
jgi:hypothetical protein